LANYIDKLDDQSGNVIYPITLTKAVYKEDTSTTLDDLLAAKLDVSAYTASDALAKIKTVDGTGSGLDADKLDGKESSAFSLSGHTHTSSNISDFSAAVSAAAPAETVSSIGTVVNGATAKNTPVDADMLPLMDSADSNKIKKFSWSYVKSVLNTYFSSIFAPLTHKHTVNNISDLAVTATELNYTDGVTSNIQTQLNSKLPATSYVASDVLTKLKTVDGTASGLDADLLDNQEGSYYLNFTNATNKPSPVITLSGDASGSATLTNMGSATLNVTVADDSHNHIISNVDGLQSALDSKTNSSLLGAANGVAQLDANGFVPASQLPSYVDDILEYNGIVNFPATGESGKIYVDTLTNLTYRWSGSSYTEISKSLALGETSSTAYAGDKGKAVTDGLASHKNNVSNPHGVTASQVGLGAFETTATNIKMNGTQSVGTLSTVARSDHVHPIDTSRAAASHTHTVSNITDLTATASEINVLDGITASTTELNYVDGVTSSIQTQLNGKQPILSFDNTPSSGSSNPVTSDGIYDALALKSPIASPTFTGTVTAPTFSGALSGNAATSTKLATARTIDVSGCVISTATRFDGSSNISIPVSTVYESYLSWGGRNFSGGYGCIDAAMIPSLGANRFAFLKAAGIAVEYSRDSGATWIDYGATDAQKTAIFSGLTSTSFAIGKADSTNKATSAYQLRITIDTNSAGIYTVLNKFCIYCSTNGSSGCACTIQAALEASPDTYITIANNIEISGWSGYNIINTSSIVTYGNTAASQYGKVRFLFTCNSGSTTYNGLIISSIYGFGGVGWTVPSIMAGSGHLYGWDASQNAIFPAQITATQFNGNATKDGNGNVIASTYLPLSGGTLKGILSTIANSYADSYSGALNLNNSNIYGVNSLIFADLADAAAEGIQFYRDSTSVDSLWGSNGVLYWTPNRTLGSTATNLTVLTSGNCNTYAPSLTGSGASGIWNIGISGNSATATKAAQDATGKVIDSTYSPIASPAFTGVPTAPTAASGTNTTQLATTAFVQSALSAGGYGDMLKSVYDTNGNGIVDNAEKVGGFTVAKSVPANAVFTDTTYSNATTSTAGLESAADKTKLNALPKITLSSTQPSSPTNGDFWLHIL
jgi:hypothetical protein